MAASDVKFRRFLPCDAQPVLELHEAALRATDAYIELPGYYDDLQDIAGRYLSGGGEFLVGEADARVVAMGGMQIHEGAVAEIRRLRVSPEVQGQGIGRQLLTHLEQAAAQRGCTRIELDTTVNQQAAQGLFTSAGYREIRHGSKGSSLETIFYGKMIAQQ